MANNCLLGIYFCFIAFPVIPLFSLQAVHLVVAWPSRQDNSPCNPIMCSEEDKSVFPSEDGSYTGYIPGDDDDSAFDSELEKAWRDFLSI